LNESVTGTRSGALRSTLSVTQNETNNGLFTLNEELEVVMDQIDECNGTLSTREKKKCPQSPLALTNTATAFCVLTHNATL